MQNLIKMTQKWQQIIFQVVVPFLDKKVSPNQIRSKYFYHEQENLGKSDSKKYIQKNCWRNRFFVGKSPRKKRLISAYFDYRSLLKSLLLHGKYIYSYLQTSKTCQKLQYFPRKSAFFPFVCRDLQLSRLAYVYVKIEWNYWVCSFCYCNWFDYFRLICYGYFSGFTKHIFKYSWTLRASEYLSLIWQPSKW